MQETPPNSPPVSGQAYDFRTEPIAQMDAATVDTHLANIFSGQKDHPYVNSRDGRHDAAVSYVTALFERKGALSPQVDEGQQVIDQMKAEKRSKAEQLRRELVGLGFDFPEDALPEDPQDFHLDIMRRDALIQQGKLSQVLPDLRRDVFRLGLHREPGLQPFLELLENAALQTVNPDLVTGRTDLDLSPLRQLATDAAFAVHRVVAKRLKQSYEAAKAHADEAARRDRGEIV